MNSFKLRILDERGANLTEYMLLLSLLFLLVFTSVQGVGLASKVKGAFEFIGNNFFSP